MLGLSLERAGLALKKENYIDSQQATDYCSIILDEVKNYPTKEHEFYRLGEQSFNSKSFMAETNLTGKSIDSIGDASRKLRYHHLVRLGGDIILSGLSEFPKATVLGAFLWLKEFHAK